MFLFISSMPSCLILMLLFPEEQVSLLWDRELLGSQGWSATPLQSLHPKDGVMARNRSISCWNTRYTSHWKTGAGISFWIERFIGKSCLQRNMCRFHLFCQAPLSVSERHPFHTCQDVFGLKIILRMFRVASRTLSREQRGETENETKDQENLCLASAENLFYVPVTAAPIPPHRYSHGRERQCAHFLASSNFWWILTRELELGGIQPFLRGRWKQLFNTRKSFLPEGKICFLRAYKWSWILRDLFPVYYEYLDYR